MDDVTGIVDELRIERGLGLADEAGIWGECVAELWDEHGNLKAREVVRNLVTDTGDQLYGSRGAGLTTTAVPTGMQIGTGSTAVAKNGAGAAIVTYLIGQAFDATFPTATNSAGNGTTATYKVTYAAGTGTTASAITEAVIVNGTVTTAGTAATVISRVLLAGIGSKGASDTLTLTWTHLLKGT